MSRRDALGLLGSAGLALPAIASGERVGARGTSNAPSAGGALRAAADPAWARGIEGQRKADLGNGTFLNPIFAGDHPDPTILKDGADYYLTHSSFEGSPGLQIWHSRDLVNWQPIASALPSPPGMIFAPDLVKHDGRYYIYFPAMQTAWSKLPSFANVLVVHADDIRGPWSAPIDVGVYGRIDPGHAVGEDGSRYLFLSAGERVALSDDGLRAAGPVEKVYAGWKYPDDWITEAYSLEGPKILRRAGWYYMISAVGGTAGPPTGHMVIVARSRSIDGPWEDCPHNPIVRTRDASERWWSRGHASFVEGPAGDWWMTYHGYENGFRTLGRQILLEPFEWTADGWPRALGGDLSRPLRMPRGGVAVLHGVARSDDFSAPAFGSRWAFHAPGPDERHRARFENGALVLAGKGTGPADASPLTGIAGDRAYEISVAVELEGDAEGGLLLFLAGRLFCGLGIDGRAMKTYGGGLQHYWREPAPAVRAMHLRIVNDRHIVTMYYGTDGRTWTRHGLRQEVSGYTANTVLPLEGGALRPAIYAAGKGSVRFREFRYRALD